MVNKTVDTQFLGLSDDEPWCFALSNDGRLAAYGVNGKIQLWDAWTGKKIHEVSAHPRQTERLAFSPDNTLLASINADDEVQLKLWKIEPINEEP